MRPTTTVGNTMTEIPLHRLYSHYSSCRGACASSTPQRCSCSAWVTCSRSSTCSTRTPDGRRQPHDVADLSATSCSLRRQRKGLQAGIGAARADVDHAAGRRDQASSSPGYRTAPTAQNTRATSSPALEKRCMSCHDGTAIPTCRISAATTTQEGDRTGHGNRRLHSGSRFAHSFVRDNVHILYRGHHFQPCLPAAGVAQVPVVGLPFGHCSSTSPSWYLVKVSHPFAWVVMAAGALMGLCSPPCGLSSMYQMWFSATPTPIARERAAILPALD